jgi:hypothetical protein
MGDEIINALADPQAEVRDAAHQALVKLGAGKTDFGPEGAEPTMSQIAAAQVLWREWWAKVR